MLNDSKRVVLCQGGPLDGKAYRLDVQRTEIHMPTDGDGVIYRRPKSPRLHVGVENETGGFEPAEVWEVEA
jgi:hypothetical protein